MAFITITAQSVAEYHNATRVPTTARWRLKRSATSYDNSDNPILTPTGSRSKPGTYQDLAVTMSGDSVILDACSIYSTTDSTVTDNTGCVDVYDQNGREIRELRSVIKNYRIPDSPTSTTWEACRIYTVGAPEPTDPTWLDQVDALIAAIAKASASIFGLTRMSYAPATVNVPIAIEQNDPVMPISALNAGMVGDGTTNIRTLLNTLVNTTLATKGGRLYFPHYQGSANTDYLISSNITLPANVMLEFAPGARLKVATGVTVTVADGRIFNKAGRQQIFNLAGTGKVSFTGRLPEVLYLEMWGAVGDGATDDLAAADALIAAINTLDPAFVSVNPKVYHRMSGKWDIDVTMRLAGLSNGSDYLNPHFTFDANSQGLVFHGLTTKTGAVVDTRTAQYSTAQYLRVHGSAGATTHTGTIAALTLTRVSGTAFSDAGGYHEGNTISVSNTDVGAFHFVIDSYVDANSVILKSPSLFVIAKNGYPYVYNVIGSANSRLSSFFVGNTITIGGSNYTITAVDNSIAAGANGYGRITLSANISGLSDNETSYLANNFGGALSCYKGAATVNGITATPAKAMRPNLFHGIDFRAQFVMDNCFVTGFAGNGLNLDSSFGLTGYPGTEPNQNTSAVTNNKLYSCYGNGAYTKSTNSNQIRFASNDSTNNFGAGFAEYSFLGNQYIGDHASFNFAGQYVNVVNSVNSSAYFACYSESGAPGSVFGALCPVVGGDHGAGARIQLGEAVGAYGLTDTYARVGGDTFTGNMGWAIRALTIADANTSVAVATDQVLNATTAGGGFNINLPTAVGNGGKWFYFKKTNAGGAAFTIGSPFAQTISGAASISLQGGSIWIYSDGANWQTFENLTPTLSGLTMADAADIVFNTTTGTKFGTAVGQKLAFWNATPIVQPSGAAQAAAAAQTQDALTDNGGGTADGTVAAMTAPGALTVTDGTGTNDGTIGAITGDASVIAAVQELAAKINSLNTLSGVFKDNFKEVTTELAKIRTDVANVKTLQDATRTALVNEGLMKGAA